MEVKDIVIITLAMLIVLLVGFMLGQRRRGLEAKDNKESTHATVTKFPSEPVLRTQPLDVNPTSPPSRDYSKQITQALAFQKRVAVIYSVLSENSIHAPFNEAYSRIDEAYQRYDTSKQEHTREELIALFSSVLDTARFEDTQKDLTAAAGEIAKSILDYYDEQLDTLFSDQPFENLGAQYQLSADLRVSQLGKISAIVLSYCSTIVTETKDIAQRRLWLQGNYQHIVNATNTELDWASTARNFGAGALAMAHPFIGIPALIANYKHQSDKDAAANAQIDRYCELFDEFENKINSLREQIIQSADQIKAYVKDKFSEVNGAAIAALLSETAANGCIIDHYFKSLNLKELEDAERELLNK